MTELEQVFYGAAQVFAYVALGGIALIVIAQWKSNRRDIERVKSRRVQS